MKRHISIFTFLLGVFAAVVFAPFADAATVAQLTITSRGYWKPGDPTDFQNLQEVSGVISPDSVNELVSAGDTFRFTAVPPERGYAVAEWYQDTDYYMQAPSPIGGTEGKLAIDWTYTGTGTTTPAIYLGISFCYLKYNVKYDKKGGTGDSSEKSNVLYTDRFNLAAAPTLTGYTFCGWLATPVGKTFGAGVEVGGAELCPETWHANNSNVTMVAQWTANTYAVSSIGSNCAVTVEETGTFDKGLSISWAPDGNWKKPTVTVYAGTDDKGTKIKDYPNLSEGTTSVAFKMSDLGVYYDKIFVKVAYEVYTLTFNPNGGACDEESRRVERGSLIGEMPKATQYQRTQEGWWDDPGAGNPITAATIYDWPGNVTAYAHWRDAELFNIDTIADPAEGGTLTGGGSYAKDEQITLTAEKNEGYSFVKWTAKTSGEEHTDPSWPITVVAGDLYTAFFTGNVYQVTFYALDGEPTVQVRAYTFGQPLGDLPMATKQGDYELEGWYTLPMGTGVKYDGESIMDHADDKLALFSNWKPIPTYHIAYNGNGSTSGSMPNQKMYCGVADNLTSNAYERVGYHFRGWATNMADAAALKIAYADGALVTDIASTNETATLYAVWDAITLGEAMHCNDPSLEWKSKKYFDATVNEWTTVFGDGIGCESDSCVRQQSGTNLGQQQWLYADVSANGHLSFMWKPSSGTSGEISVAVINKNEMPGKGDYVPVAYSATGWQVFEIDIDVSKGHFIHIANSGTSECLIDRMTWGWPEPKDGVDNVTISSATVSDEKFILSFKSDEKFDYNLLTNANLLINEGWGVMGEKKIGDGSILTFEPKIIEGQPQLFYKVETIQRK